MQELKAIQKIAIYLNIYFFIMQKPEQKQLIVSRSQLNKTQVVSVPAPNPEELESGELILQIEKFGFTANNITYAVVGEMVRYWEFFPAKEGWGIVPVWGYAKVVHSNAEGIKPGDRYYGYLPMAEMLKVKVGKLNPAGFSDGSAHRADLAPIYNFYSKAEIDSGFAASSEAVQMIFRPLFTTSFLLDIFLDWSKDFGAEQVVLTSASSKTAFALAYLLANRESDKKKVSIVGLTSPGNVAFVESMGFYDEVRVYDDAANLQKKNTVIVDFAGNLDVLKTIADSLTDQLKFTSMVGMVDWKNSGDAKAKGVDGQFFFAPAFIRDVYKKWGIELFQTNLAKAWNAFQGSAESLLDIQEINGFEAAQQLYLEMLAGKSSAQVGYNVVV